MIAANAVVIRVPLLVHPDEETVVSRAHGFDQTEQAIPS